MHDERRFLQEADFSYLTGIQQPGVAVIESLASHPPGKLTMFLPRHVPLVCDLQWQHLQNLMRHDHSSLQRGPAVLHLTTAEAGVVARCPESSPLHAVTRACCQLGPLAQSCEVTGSLSQPPSHRTTR